MDNAPGTQPLWLRTTAAVLLVSLVVGLVFLFNKTNTVSASELLERSVKAQNERINSTDQPVVHQKLRVKRKKSAQTTGQENEVSWETWNDTVNSRIKNTILIADKTPSPAGNSNTKSNKDSLLKTSTESMLATATLSELERNFTC